jgi:pyruvate dehydrogenase E2 component (dihydrolipoamide acetyltransferase)
MTVVEVRLADVGEGLDEGEVVRWLVVPGEAVRRDQPLAEVQTDKATVEVPAPLDGTVTELHVAVGDVVPVGTLLVTLSPVDSTAPARPKASPATRRRAAAAGVDLAAIVGTGPGGRITEADLEVAPVAAVSAPAAPAPAVTGVPPTSAPLPPPPAPTTGAFRGVRRATAAAMSRSWSSIPHLGVMDELDATALVAARDRLAAGAATPITLTALLAVAVGRTLRRHPVCNATVHDDGRGATVHADVHLGVACATPDGLVVPVVRHADRLGVEAMAGELARLTGAARAGRLSPADLAGGTATLTNYGPLGGRFASPVVPPGQTLIVGIGAVAPRPWVLDGTVVVRPLLPWSLSADHRLVDGADALAFARDLVAVLTEPVLLLR